MLFGGARRTNFGRPGLRGRILVRETPTFERTVVCLSQGTRRNSGSKRKRLPICESASPRPFWGSPVLYRKNESFLLKTLDRGHFLQILCQRTRGAGCPLIF